jgi:hypothetical protein
MTQVETRESLIMTNSYFMGEIYRIDEIKFFKKLLNDYERSNIDF